MRIKVFAKVQDKKIRCEILRCFKNEETKKSYIIIFAPFMAERDTIIPLLFDPNLTNQEAAFLVEEQDKNVIEGIINQEVCEIQYVADEDIAFEIYIDQRIDDNISESAYELAKRLGVAPHLPFDIDEAIEAIDKKLIHLAGEEYVSKLSEEDTAKKNVMLGLIQYIAKQKVSIAHIPLNIIDTLLASDKIVISTEEMVLKKSFENILKVFGKSEIISQDVENALVSLVECNSCTNELFDIIMRNEAFKEKLSQDVLQRMQSNVILRVPCFFKTKDVKVAARFYYAQKEYDNSLKLYQQLHTRIENSESNNDEIIEVLNVIGNCYVGIMQFDNACKIFKQITEIDATYAIAYNNWAYTLSVECDTISEKDIRQNKLQEALACINDAIQINPQDISFISNRAFIEYELGQYNQVIRDLGRARKISKKYTDISTILKLTVDSKIKLGIAPSKKIISILGIYMMSYVLFTIMKQVEKNYILKHWMSIIR